MDDGGNKKEGKERARNKKERNKKIK